MSEQYYIGVNEYGTYIISQSLNAWNSGHTVAGPFDTWGEADEALSAIIDEEEIDD